MDFVARSKEVFQVEINEIQRVANRIGDEVNQVVELIYAHTAKIVITGIG